MPLHLGSYENPKLSLVLELFNLVQKWQIEEQNSIR